MKRFTLTIVMDLPENVGVEMLRKYATDALQTDAGRFDIDHPLFGNTRGSIASAKCTFKHIDERAIAPRHGDGTVTRI